MHPHSTDKTVAQMDITMTYTTHGLTSLHELLGDLVVYRNLVPADNRLPPLAGVRDHLGLDKGRLPRKAEPAYGRVVAEVLRRARKLDLPGTAIRRLIYVGDTRMNDGTAFRNLCAAGEWPGHPGDAGAGGPIHREILPRDRRVWSLPDHTEAQGPLGRGGTLASPPVLETGSGMGPL